jgi:hypothetical protein
VPQIQVEFESEGKQGGKMMTRKSFFVLLIMTLSLASAVPALAAAPVQGLVVEGVSVPGIDLGSSRAQVQDAYGEPQSCQSGSVAGDFSYCAHLVEGGGRVWIRYRGADGGHAGNSPDDVAYFIHWEEGASAWTTTAGVNTTLARVNPAAVLAAYPGAQVSYNMFGSILQVKDYELGIQVNWTYDFYSGTTAVGMAISERSAPPPPREKLVRVESIELLTNKTRGERQIRALVRVEDDRTLAVPGATLFATWQLPDGTAKQAEAVTSGSGYAYFEILDARKGTYTLTVDDVFAASHRFDRASSVLSEGIKVR